MMNEELTETILTVDEDGNFFTIYKFTDMHLIPTFGGRATKEPGLSTLRLENGEVCNVVNDSEFHVVKTGQILRRSQPA